MISGPSGTSGPWPFTSRTLPTTRSFSTFFYLTLAFSASILAQDVSLLPSAASDSFPACGLTCSLLAQAETSCTPPSVAVSNQQTYVSCFCQSPAIIDFQNSPDNTCLDTCAVPTDRQLLQQWYLNFCNNGGDTEDSDDTDTESDTEADVEEDSTNSNTGNSNNNSNTNNDNSNTNSNSNNNNDNDNDDSDVSSAADTTAPTARPADPHYSWWDSHYKWVIMVIVLAVAFTAIAILGIWLKRRHDAKYPNLYHGGTDSRVFQTPSSESPVPGALPAAVLARRHDSANTVSIASSSRTEVIPSKYRQSPAPSRLQKSQGPDDIEIREAPR
ncbi:hypothetical protein BJY04DRAFT_8824 [Aspergillus karnatakaensis]|uniref:uncharacterized protein n=1 Tax=Aspergillus karnatakaensis TaxID=1810916 RepID=UPI003CCD992D